MGGKNKRILVGLRRNGLGMSDDSLSEGCVCAMSFHDGLAASFYGATKLCERRLYVRQGCVPILWTLCRDVKDCETSFCGKAHPLCQSLLVRFTSAQLRDRAVAAGWLWFLTQDYFEFDNSVGAVKFSNTGHVVLGKPQNDGSAKSTRRELSR